MTRIRLSLDADADLEDILNYSILHHGHDAAEAYLRKIHKTLERVFVFPGLGAPESDLHQGSRSIPAGEHRVYYRHDGDTVFVARILHKRMDARRRL